MRDDHVNMANYQAAVDVAETLTRELRSTLNGNGLGRFEAVPSCAKWWRTKAGGSTLPPAHSADHGSARDGNEAFEHQLDAKRQKLGASEVDRLKTMGVFNYCQATAGASHGRLPTVNVFAKKKGAKTPERLCMKFLTRGHVCEKEACKLPHVPNIDNLPLADRSKLLAFVKKQKGLSWVAGKAPPGTD